MTPTTKLSFQLVVSLAVILPFWGFVFCLFFFATAIDPSVRESLNQITGAVTLAFGGVIGFWLGTSLSSASKNDTISNLTNGTKP